MKKISVLRAFVMISQMMLIIVSIYTIIIGKYKLAVWDLTFLVVNISFAGFMGSKVDKP